MTVGYVTRPILLLLDGLSSHYSPDTIHSGAEEQVIIFADLSVCEDAIQTAIQSATFIDFYLADGERDQQRLVTEALFQVSLE